MFFFMGLFGAKLFARVTLIPDTLLWSSVFVPSAVGAYCLDQSMLDVWIMIGSGFLGYVMRRFGFSVLPVAMGLVLGELVETNLEQSLVIFDGNWLLLCTRPIAVAFFILALAGLFGGTTMRWLWRRFNL